jgi:hypothetical protein
MSYLHQLPVGGEGNGTKKDLLYNREREPGRVCNTLFPSTPDGHTEKQAGARPGTNPNPNPDLRPQEQEPWQPQFPGGRKCDRLKPSLRFSSTCSESLRFSDNTFSFLKL